jgi:hypothetical protein
MPIRRSLRPLGALLFAAGVAFPASAVRQACALLPEHAAIIVMQSPTAVKSKSSGGCPVADYRENQPGMASFQLRNLCASNNDAVLATYRVDLTSGRVFESGASKPVESPALRATAAYVCSMSVRGVVPSLLPHATVRRKSTARPASSLISSKPPVKK